MRIRTIAVTMEQRAATGGLAGAALGAAVADDSLTGAIVGGVAGAAVGAATTPNRREYYDQRAGRYYYRDRSTGRYYWEDGTPRR